MSLERMRIGGAENETVTAYYEKDTSNNTCAAVMYMNQTGGVAQIDLVAPGVGSITQALPPWVMQEIRVDIPLGRRPSLAGVSIHMAYTSPPSV